MASGIGNRDHVALRERMRVHPLASESKKRFADWNLDHWSRCARSRDCKGIESNDSSGRVDEIAAEDDIETVSVIADCNTEPRQGDEQQRHRIQDREASDHELRVFLHIACQTRSRNAFNIRPVSPQISYS